MTAVNLLKELRGRGVRIDVVGNRLRLDAPKGALTAELRAVLTEKKREILTLLKSFDDEVSWRVEEMLKQIPSEGQIPFLVARRAFIPGRNCCHSCGDYLKEDAGYICGLCSRAMDYTLEIVMTQDQTQGVQCWSTVQ